MSPIKQKLLGTIRHITFNMNRAQAGAVLLQTGLMLGAVTKEDLRRIKRLSEKKARGTKP